MTRRRPDPAPGRTGALFLIAALSASLLPFALPTGCSEDTSSSSQGGPTGDPSLSILGAACADGGLCCTADSGPCCMPIGTDPDARIPIEVAVQEVLLRPPGVCGTLKQCGQLVLRVNGVENNTGSGTVIDVLMRKLADRYTDLTISVSVRNDQGDAILDHSDTPQPISASISITTQQSCSSSSTGSSSGGGTGGMGGATAAGTGGAMSSSSGASGAGGVSGSGGAGGMGGTGGSTASSGIGGAGGAGGLTSSSGMGGIGGAGGAGASGTGGTGG